MALRADARPVIVRARSELDGHASLDVYTYIMRTEAFEPASAEALFDLPCACQTPSARNPDSDADL